MAKERRKADKQKSGTQEKFTAGAINGCHLGQMKSPNAEPMSTPKLFRS